MGMLKNKPDQLQKFLFKVPVWLHKMGLGGWERLIGAQWMLITTIGRKTGKRRDVMVDVMDYNRNTDTYYIEAAYGAHADWYKNIQSNPIFEARASFLKNCNTTSLMEIPIPNQPVPILSIWYAVRGINNDTARSKH